MLRRVVVFDAADMAAESAFWVAMLGGHVIAADDEGWVIGVQHAPNHVPPEWPDGTPQQVHLDLHVTDFAAAHATAMSLGARLLQPAADLDAEEGHQVDADPRGVMSPSSRRGTPAGGATAHL